MTDTDLYQIVKDHRDAWPEDVWCTQLSNGEWFFTLWGKAMQTALLAFEASFHRAILQRTNVSVDKWPDGFIVRIRSESFDSPRLIEAYAKALEYLK